MPWVYGRRRESRVMFFALSRIGPLRADTTESADGPLHESKQNIFPHIFSGSAPLRPHGVSRLRSRYQTGTAYETRFLRWMGRVDNPAASPSYDWRTLPDRTAAYGPVTTASMGGSAWRPHHGGAVAMRRGRGRSSQQAARRVARTVAGAAVPERGRATGGRRPHRCSAAG